MKLLQKELRIQNKKVLQSEDNPDNRHDDLDRDSGSGGVI
jgi:hypothetical protein